VVAGDITGIGEELRREAQRAVRLEVRLRAKRITRADDDDTVTATIDGGGRLTELKLDDSALQHPAALGARITVAINRARDANTRLREAAREKYLPGTAPTASADAVFADHLDTRDFEMTEGSAAEHNRIAEAIGAYNKVIDARNAFKKLRLKCEVGNGLGEIMMNADGSNMNVSIRADAPRLVGLDHLARNTLDAVHRLEDSAARLRRRELEEIALNGETVGERLGKARELADDLLKQVRGRREVD
jgi:DNA-binding protein YbaB